MNKEFNLEEAEDFIDNVYQHKFDYMEENLEDGTQVVHLGGLDNIKFTDFESASFTLLRGEQRLKHQVKKQKEVIDKVVECLNLWQIPECDKGTMREILFNTNKQNVLDILNEVLE